MKDNLENSIKQSLENYELPFNASAWSAMSSKLDASVPVNGDASSSMENAVKSSLENNIYPYSPLAWDALNTRLDANTGTGVDQAIKSSLENYELPYAASAWTALSSKLDVPRSNTKWYIAATALIAVAAASYFIITNQTEENMDSNTTVAKVSEVNDHNSRPTGQDNGSTDSKPSFISDGDDSNDNGTTFNPAENLSGNGNTIISSGNTHRNPNPTDTGYLASITTALAFPVISPDPVITDPEPHAFIMPVVSNVCEGESIHIKNENSYSLTIVYPSGSLWIGKENSQTTLSASIPGTYQIGHMNAGAFTQAGTFKVFEAPSADFNFVDLGEILLDGLPTTEVESSSNGRLEWKSGKQRSTGNTASPHFFKKGNHDVALTVTGEDGCQTTIIKSVSIEKDYNLIAAKAFDPRSLDSRNNTFMPNGLVKRENVKFSMIIIDPNDGHIMYTTSDSSEGWDGIDRRNGDMVAYQKSFIWKVSIENPEQGEKSVYSDDAIIIPRQN